MKISQELRDFAAKQEAVVTTKHFTEEEAETGMQAMSDLYRQSGEELYVPALPDGRG